MSERRPSSAWASQATRMLAATGHRRGAARRAILELLDEQSCALSATQIQQALRARDREVSRASVYRVMEELEQAGLLQRLDLGQGMVRYEPIRRGVGHHHHIVCDRCGSLEPFADEELERAIERLSKRLAVRVFEHEVVLRGDCGSCAEELSRR